MQLSDVFNTRTIAFNRTENISNREPFVGSIFFPDRKKMGIDLQWIKAHKGVGVALKPSTPDAIPTVRPRGEVKATNEQMPFFRESRDIKEKDLFELSRITDSGSPFLQPVIDSLYDDVNDLLDGAEITAEWMRMQLLAPKDGELKISIPIADNLIHNYDYDADDSWQTGHFLDVQDASEWDKEAAKPLTDIRKGIQALASVGVTARYILGNSTTFDYLLENAQVKNALLSITGQTIDFLDESTVEEILRRKLKLERIVYDKTFVDYEGKEQKFYPDNYVTIIGSGALGNTWRGTTPEELTSIGFMGLPTPPVDITVLDNGVAVAIQNVYKPSFTAITTAAQIVLPSFEGMDSIYVIKVKSEAV